LRKEWGLGQGLVLRGGWELRRRFCKKVMLLTIVVIGEPRVSQMRGATEIKRGV